MTKANQKILYEHYKKLSVDGTTEKQRTEHKRYAAQILVSFPDFEVKEKPKETKSNKEK